MHPNTIFFVFFCAFIPSGVSTRFKTNERRVTEVVPPDVSPPAKEDTEQQGQWINNVNDPSMSSDRRHHDRVFKVVWNLPRNQCEPIFGVPLNLSAYGILSNAVNQTSHGEVITIFYNDAIGLYPYYESDEHGDVIKYNAGLPQVSFSCIAI